MTKRKTSNNISVSVDDLNFLFTMANTFGIVLRKQYYDFGKPMMTDKEYDDIQGGMQEIYSRYNKHIPRPKLLGFYYDEDPDTTF